MSKTAVLRKTIDELAGRDVQELRQALASEMDVMGWDILLGKKRGGEQSLLDHSLSVFDALSACLPFFAEECAPLLKPEETIAALIAAVGHDSGKAQDDFQAYLHGTSAKFAEHVGESLIRETVDRLTNAAKANLGPWIQDVVSSAILHDRRMRRPKGEFAEWERDHVSPRWRKLADVVNHADTLASLENVPAARRFLSKSPTLLAGASVASYQVHLRGVSTTLLHAAALASFEEQDWSCLVYFGDGAVLAARHRSPPDPVQIARRLQASLQRMRSERVDESVRLAVGDLTGDFLPSPGYVTAENISGILAVAASKIGRQEFKPDRLKTLRAQWFDETQMEMTEGDGSMLQAIGPEIAMFKMAKNVFERVLPEEGSTQGSQMKPGRSEYFDGFFGEGAYERMMQQSTLMLVRDYRLSVQSWHKLTAGPDRTIADLSAPERAKRLEALLIRVLHPLLESRELPAQRVTADWTRALMVDFVLPEAGTASARDQLAGYVASKEESGASSLQCCQCASEIYLGQDERGKAALGNKGSYSNRRLAFANPGDPAVCKRCSTDIRLTQLMLGRSKVETLIAAVPRRSLGPMAAERLKQQVLGFRSVLDRQLSAATMDLAGELPLWSPARILGRADAFPECFVQPLFVEGKKRRVEKLQEALDELLTDEAMKALGFSSCEALANALVDGAADAGARQDPSVVRAIRSVTPGVAFGADSPSLTVMAFDQGLGGSNTPDADRAILAFALAALFALKLNVAVAVCSPADLRTALDSRNGRAVYVPPNGAVRRMLGADWLPIDPSSPEPDATRWLAGIQGAIRLQALMSGAGAKAPALLEILRYPNAGFAIQQVEARTSTKVFWPTEWLHIEALKEILR